MRILMPWDRFAAYFCLHGMIGKYIYTLGIFNRWNMRWIRFQNTDEEDGLVTKHFNFGRFGYLSYTITNEANNE